MPTFSPHMILIHWKRIFADAYADNTKIRSDSNFVHLFFILTLDSTLALRKSVELEKTFISKLIQQIIRQLIELTQNLFSHSPLQLNSWFRMPFLHLLTSEIFAIGSIWVAIYILTLTIPWKFNEKKSYRNKLHLDKEFIFIRQSSILNRLKVFLSNCIAELLTRICHLSFLYLELKMSQKLTFFGFLEDGSRI